MNFMSDAFALLSSFSFLSFVLLARAIVSMLMIS